MYRRGVSTGRDGGPDPHFIQKKTGNPLKAGESFPKFFHRHRVSKKVLELMFLKVLLPRIFRPFFNLNENSAC